MEREWRKESIEMHFFYPQHFLILFLLSVSSLEGLVDLVLCSLWYEIIGLLKCVPRYDIPLDPDPWPLP